ncbi:MULTISPECIES: BMP family ABC transporter substrate-binding protein [unclassified Sedimentibacter]|uniref:BMP family ABC transporter substrate-binding protein n=1 Tax=unclassified Sedimentibacter TaxID=2649220 RepID=UPI0027E0F23E|nr:BMP family ABC transporter substrate-binding protein [Sedimentibacter sp. MB35-C1]WMJ77937.1 BMP family ABC transporter substrate-binding protein [Sedimentibacter sp. MB35-C1]
MKKFLSIILSLVMIFSLAACAQKPAAEEPQSEAPASEGTEQSGSGLFPAIAKEDIKVAVIHIGNPADGSGYTYAHDQGIVGMQEALGLDDSQIIRKNNVNDTDPTATETAILEAIEEGANIIFGTSWGYMDIMEALAEEYPEVIFSHGTGYKSNDTNFNNYFGRIYQARYLTGIAAGLKTESNLVGYVAAMGQQNSEVTGGIDAFAMGVYSVNPDAKVYVKVTNSWYSPEEETNAAKALLAEGCDVIAQHCDTPNPQLEAEKAGKWGIGYNSDMSKDAPKATITSAVWDWSAYYTTAVENVINGTWTNENYFGGMEEGLVGISPLNESVVAEGTADAIAEAEQSILDGSFNIFDGVIETNDGSTVGEEGKTLDDATITGGINWYFKTVEVK